MNSSNKGTLRRGFTLIEIMVVVITLGVIASLALVNSNKVVEQSYCQNAQRNLIRIYQAFDIYTLKHPTTTIGSLNNSAAINARLNINIDDPKFDYSMYAPVPGRNNIMANRTNGPSYTCSVSNPAALSATNPNCFSSAYCSSVISSTAP